MDYFFAGEYINRVARMPAHQSQAVTLERYDHYMPNLTGTEGKALLAAEGKVWKI